MRKIPAKPPQLHQRTSSSSAAAVPPVTPAAATSGRCAGPVFASHSWARLICREGAPFATGHLARASEQAPQAAFESREGGQGARRRRVAPAPAACRPPRPAPTSASRSWQSSKSSPRWSRKARISASLHWRKSVPMAAAAAANASPVTTSYSSTAVCSRACHTRGASLSLRGRPGREGRGEGDGCRRGRGGGGGGRGGQRIVQLRCADRPAGILLELAALLQLHGLDL